MHRCRSFTIMLVLGAALGGCGSEPVPPPPPSPPSAATERAERDARRSARALARLRAEKARLEASRPATVEPPVLPAGSAEIDGPGRAGAGLFSPLDRRSFARLAASLAGEEAIAVAPIAVGGSVTSLGGLEGGAAWSTSKVPVAMAAIAAGTARPADLRQAITVSDNAAAERLWTGLGGGAKAARAADAQLRLAGDRTTRFEAQPLRAGFTAFGQTGWRVTDQARFVAGMACTPAGPRLLALMGEVNAAQRWGLGSVGASAAVKGGWGPGVTPGRPDGWFDRQMGVITVDGRRVAVALATTAPDHATGTAALTRLATWTAAHVRGDRLAPPAC